MSGLTSDEQTRSRLDVRNELGDWPRLELHRHGVAASASVPLVDGERGARNLSELAVVDAVELDHCSVERPAPLGESRRVVLECAIVRAEDLRIRRWCRAALRVARAREEQWDQSDQSDTK